MNRSRKQAASRVVRPGPQNCWQNKNPLECIQFAPPQPKATRLGRQSSGTQASPPEALQGKDLQGAGKGGESRKILTAHVGESGSGDRVNVRSLSFSTRTRLTSPSPTWVSRMIRRGRPRPLPRAPPASRAGRDGTRSLPATGPCPRYPAQSARPCARALPPRH